MNNFSQLRTIFYALAVGQIGFAAVVYYLNGGNTNVSDMPIFTLLVPAVLLGSAGMAYFLNQRLAEQEAAETTPEGRFAAYRRRVIIRLAMLEGANLMAVVAVLLTGKMNFFLFFLLGMLIFYYFQPKESEMAGGV